MIKLGYSSSGGPTPKYSIKDRIRFLASLNTNAIELGYVSTSRLSEALDNEDIRMIKKFDYISIHAPVLLHKDGDIKEYLRYPSDEAEKFLEQILNTVHLTKADTILVHPDLVDDFPWLNKKLGNLLAFENMDAEKSFGKTVEDLKEVFKKSPEAKWVCDINHIYTIDRSMKLADVFHKAFQDKLCHYHISSYNGFHDCFYITHEDEILSGIKDFSVPLIHEGLALRDGLESLTKETEYIRNKLGKKY